MLRIFTCLAGSHLLLLAATFILGLISQRAHTQRHVALAVFVLILACLIQVLVFTYFTVTGKMMTQAIHLGRLDPAPLVHVNRAKRNSSILLAALMLTIVFVAATGASHWRFASESNLHLLAGGLVVSLQPLGWLVDFKLILAHGELFDRTMRDYARQKASNRDSSLIIDAPLGLTSSSP